MYVSSPGATLVNDLDHPLEFLTIESLDRFGQVLLLLEGQDIIVSRDGRTLLSRPPRSGCLLERRSSLRRFAGRRSSRYWLLTSHLLWLLWHHGWPRSVSLSRRYLETSLCKDQGVRGNKGRTAIFVVLAAITLGSHMITINRAQLGLGRFFHLLLKSHCSSIPARSMGVSAVLNWKQLRIMSLKSAKNT